MRSAQQTLTHKMGISLSGRCLIWSEHSAESLVDEGWDAAAAEHQLALDAAAAATDLVMIECHLLGGFECLLEAFLHAVVGGLAANVVQLEMVYSTQLWDRDAHIFLQSVLE